MQQKASSNPKISFVWNNIVEEIFGDNKVNGIRKRNTAYIESICVKPVYWGGGRRRPTS